MSGNESGPVKKDDGFSDLEARLSGSCGRTNSGRCLIEGPSYYNNNDSSAQASSSGVSLRRLFSLSSVSASCPRLDEELENEIVSQAGDIGIRSSRQGENYFHFAKEQGGLGFQTPQELLLNSNTISPAVSPLVSDIITPPLTTSLLHKEQQEEMIKELPPCFEYIAYLIHLAVFGIIGVLTRFVLQKLFGSSAIGLTSNQSILYADLPSNMIGSDGAKCTHYVLGQPHIMPRLNPPTSKQD